MARYNTVSTTGSVAGGNSIATPYSGLLTTLTGSGTVTLPNPTYYAGQTQTYYNSTGANIVLNTPSGVFNGPGASSSSNITLPAGSIITISSDATNYLVESWLGGNSVAVTLSASGSVTFNPSNSSISLQPTGTGTVNIAPGTAGTIDNMAIGATTRSTGAFTTLTANGATTLTSNGAASAYNTSGAALLVGGGVGIAGAVYTNSTATFANTLTVSSGGAVVTGNSSVTGTLQTTGLNTITVTSSTATLAGTHIQLTNPSGSQIVIGANFNSVNKGSLRFDNSGNVVLNATSGNFYFNNDTSPTSINLVNGNTTFLSTSGSNGISVPGTVSAGTFSGSGASLTGTGSSFTAGAVTNGVYTNTGNTFTQFGGVNSNYAKSGSILIPMQLHNSATGQGLGVPTTISPGSEQYFNALGNMSWPQGSRVRLWLVVNVQGSPDITENTTLNIHINAIGSATPYDSGFKLSNWTVYGRDWGDNYQDHNISPMFYMGNNNYGLYIKNTGSTNYVQIFGYGFIAEPPDGYVSSG